MMINDDGWKLSSTISFPLNWHFLYLFMSLPALPYLAMIWCPNIQGSAQETVGIINVEALIRHLGAHSVGSLALSCRVWTGWSIWLFLVLNFLAGRKSQWNCRPFSHSKPRKYTYTYTHIHIHITHIHIYIYIYIYPGNTEASIAIIDFQRAVRVSQDTIHHWWWAVIKLYLNCNESQSTMWGIPLETPQVNQWWYSRCFWYPW